MQVGDLLRDVTVEMHARRARAGLMMAAVGLSTGALLSAVGISDVAARQVDADLAASTVTFVSVAPASGVEATAGRPVFPADTESRVSGIDLVRAAGRRLDLDTIAEPTVTRLTGSGLVTGVTVIGATAGYLDAAGTPAPAGWVLDHDHPAALLGEAAARALDIPRTVDPTGLSVYIDGRAYPVVGFLPAGDIDLSSTIAIPYGMVTTTAGGDTRAQLLVRTEPGAGTVVSEVVRDAVRPDAPEALVSSQVVDVMDLRTGVSTQMDRLIGGVGGLLLALTVLLIGNAMVVSVMSRTGEIGLRRAMGTSRGRVAALFWAEGALSGAIGGLSGSALAVIAVVAVSAASGWTAATGPLLLLGPLIGTGAGLVSSLYPALRAASIEPAQAVRAD